MKTFAERLKFAMAEVNLNQFSLAEKSGASKAAISQYLSGKNTPSTNRMKILADITGVSVDFLMGLEEIPDTERPLLTQKITPRMAARCLRISDQAVRVNMQNGNLPIGRVLKGSGTKLIYVIAPEKLREEAGEARFNEFFQLTVCPVCGGMANLSVGENGRTQDGATVQRRHYEQQQSHAPQVDGADG